MALTSPNEHGAGSQGGAQVLEGGEGRGSVGPTTGVGPAWASQRCCRAGSGRAGQGWGSLQACLAGGGLSPGALPPPGQLLPHLPTFLASLALGSAGAQRPLQPRLRPPCKQPGLLLRACPVTAGAIPATHSHHRGPVSLPPPMPPAAWAGIRACLAGRPQPGRGPEGVERVAQAESLSQRGGSGWSPS